MDESTVKKYGNRAKMELLPIFEECLTEGYAEGQKDCRKAKTEGYYEGLQQLWDCFKAYTEMVQMDKFNAVGYGTFEELFDKITPTWFVGKMKEFGEQTKAEEETKNNEGINVDDEIYSEMTNTKAVIVFIDSWGRWQCLCDRGFFTVDDDAKKYWTKTGRQFDVEGILKAMREG